MPEKVPPSFERDLYGDMAGINAFAGGAPQADDLTLIVVRFGPQ